MCAIWHQTEYDSSLSRSFSRRSVILSGNVRWLCIMKKNQKIFLSLTTQMIYNRYQFPYKSMFISAGICEFSINRTIHCQNGVLRRVFTLKKASDNAVLLESYVRQRTAVIIIRGKMALSAGWWQGVDIAPCQIIHIPEGHIRGYWSIQLGPLETLTWIELDTRVQDCHDW